MNNGLEMVDDFGAIRLKGKMSNDVFYVSEMSRTEECKRVEKIFEDTYELTDRNMRRIKK